MKVGAREMMCPSVLDKHGFSQWIHRNKYSVLTLTNCRVDHIDYPGTVYMLMKGLREEDGSSYWASIPGVRPFATVLECVQYANSLENPSGVPGANPEQTQKEPMANPQETQSVIADLKEQVKALQGDNEYLIRRVELAETRLEGVIGQRDTLQEKLSDLPRLQNQLVDLLADRKKLRMQVEQITAVAHHPV